MRTYILSAILALATSAALAQNLVGQSNEAATAAASSTTQPKCDTAGAQDLPIAFTIEAKVTGLLDSAHLKPGQEVTVQVVTEWQFPGCNLPARSILYGHVTAVSSAKKPDASELALVFDHGQCDGRSKKAIPFTVIGVVAPPDQFVGYHSAMPSELSGGGRDISATAANMGSFTMDENLNPGGPPRTVHPGIVVGIPKMKLEPHGGPDCSTRMTSTNRSVRLGTGSELILTMQAAPE
jgi:hypothetical protein